MLDIVLSFDTTGSMYSCLSQVRETVARTVQRLFKDIPGIRVGVIAHGDYCDGDRVITILDLCSDQRSIIDFVRNVRSTHGGDFPECYEYVLHRARSISWIAGRQRALVMIGDAIPHNAYEPQNKNRLDWRNELKLLLESSIHVHAVQCLNRHESTSFWKEIAQTTGGHHLSLNQFSHVVDLITALTYQQADFSDGRDVRINQFEDEVERSGRMNRDMAATFDTLRGRKTPKARRATIYKATKAEHGLIPVSPGRFQVMGVPVDCSIKEFVERNGLLFETGRGFYELTKTVSVQDYKEVILQNRRTGDMYCGAEARKLLSLPTFGTVRINHKAIPPEFKAYIQSTSLNRKLLGSTNFLYEVDFSR